MTVTAFDRRIAKVLASRVEQLVADAIKAEFGVVVSRGSGRFDASSYTLKLDFSIPVTQMPVPVVSEDEVKYGLAPRGAKILYFGNRATVLKARRNKYLVEFEHKVGSYLLPFAHCTVAK